MAGRDRRMVDMGLNELLADDAVFAEVREGGWLHAGEAEGLGMFAVCKAFTKARPEHPSLSLQVHERQGEENQSRRGNKGKEEEALGKGVQHITAFFTAGAAPAAAVGEEEGGAA